MTSTTSNKRAAVLAAFQAAAVKALGLSKTDLTLDGMGTLSGAAGRSAARLCLAIYVWEMSTGDLKAKRTERRAEVIKATGLSKGTVSNYFRAGDILARIGERAGEVEVMHAAAAVCSKWNAAECATRFAGKTGGPLAVAILKADAEIKATVRKTRGPASKPDAKGTDAATAEAAKRTPTKVIADTAHDLSKITDLGKAASKADADALNAAIKSLVAESLRIAALAGIDAADVVASEVAA